MDFLGTNRFSRSQYFDSESAATPSLGRRVETETSGGRQCCCAIVLPVSWVLLDFHFGLAYTTCCVLWSDMAEGDWPLA